MPSFAPYLSRLVLDWSADGGLGVRELEGTLVSVDLSGFTALSERLQAKGRAGAEELTLAVSGVFEGLIGITERHGGDVLKFRGDALLLFFDGEDHERRACYAAADMQWLIGATGEMMSSVGPVTLRMSTGVYTGHLSLLPRRGHAPRARHRRPCRDGDDRARVGRRGGRDPAQRADGRGARAGLGRSGARKRPAPPRAPGARSRGARGATDLASCRTRSSCTCPSRCERTCCSRPARRSTARSPPPSSSSRVSTT